MQHPAEPCSPDGATGCPRSSPVTLLTQDHDRRCHSHPIHAWLAGAGRGPQAAAIDTVIGSQSALLEWVSRVVWPVPASS